MSSRRIHLVFKTHLDIGFTDHAEKVRRLYHERFIPQALDTGTHFFDENPTHPKFIWTTGAWLIWDHLETQGPEAVARLEQAIERGLVRWHALPFTTHSELMSPALFRAGLSYAAALDGRFGITTTAAKMTDVPGHTRGIVPLLAEAGVHFLHIGVNTASPVPDVPDVFRWRAPGGEEVVVMVQNSYGATHLPAGLDEGLSFAHTSDNIGPQSVPQAVEAHRRLQTEHPEAEIVASTLDAYGELLWARREDFPVVDLEIGDSWIHGVASDPQKTARFLALQRLYDRFANDELTPQRLAFGRRLALVAEHTWGVDIKSYLRDETAWDRQDFDRLRSTDPRFAYTESSWAEQRAYLDAAVAELQDTDRDAAAGVLPGPVTPSGEAMPAEEGVKVGGWDLTLDPETGDIVRLQSPAGIGLDGADGSLFGYRHESYDHADMVRQLDSYLQHRESWAILDHDKPGLEKARTARSAAWAPQLREVRGTADAVSISSALPGEVVGALGGPAAIELTLRPLDDAVLELALVLRKKPANRMPEAGFFHLRPAGAHDWDYQKLGLWQPAMRVVPRGGAGLQAVALVRARLAAGRSLQVEPRHTPLVAPADAPFMQYEPAPHPLAAGIRFNLYNNKWGTNFPQWCEGDLVARFRLRLA
jgi:hypothetical protein